MVIYDERSGDDFRGNLRTERRRSERIDKIGNRDSASRFQFAKHPFQRITRQERVLTA